MHIDLATAGEDVLILRPDADVEVRLLPAGGAVFLRALGDGAAILDAMKAALASDSRFDLSGNIAGLVAANAIVGYRTSDDAGVDIFTGQP